VRAQTLAAAAGWRWILGGLAIYRRNPPILSMLVVSYWFIVVLLNIFPVVGALAASAVIPALSVGLMQATRNLERGVPLNMQTLFSAFGERTRSLLLLGALYLLCTLGVLGVSIVADGGDLLRYMLASNPVERAALEESNFALPGLLVAALMTPLMMAWWFAPVLVAWHRLTIAKALFFSFVACWMNWRPFLVYGLALLLAAVIGPGILLGLLLILLPGAQQFATVIVTVAIALIIAPTIFASFYVGYRDIFGISEIV